MDAYADGDNGAFEILYDELAPRLYAYLLRITGSGSVAEDILQQCFLNMHQARARFNRGTRVEPWAFAIARRLTIDRARVEGRTSSLSLDRLATEMPSPETYAHQAEFVEALRTELESVPTQLREAFLLVRLEGFSTAEAAETLGTTVAAVKVRAHRVGALLRDRLSHLRASGGTND